MKKLLMGIDPVFGKILVFGCGALYILLRTETKVDRIRKGLAEKFGYYYFY